MPETEVNQLGERVTESDILIWIDKTYTGVHSFVCNFGWLRVPKLYSCMKVGDPRLYGVRVQFMTLVRFCM